LYNNITKFRHVYIDASGSDVSQYEASISEIAIGYSGLDRDWRSSFIIHSPKLCRNLHCLLVRDRAC